MTAVGLGLLWKYVAATWHRPFVPKSSLRARGHIIVASAVTTHTDASMLTIAVSIAPWLGGVPAGWIVSEAVVLLQYMRRG